jgi:hypothetical protein
MAIPVWPPGGEVHLLVRTVVSAGRFAILDASATASASATDSSPSNNWSEATYPVAGTSMRPKADVGISVGAGPLGQTSGGFPAILSQNGRANFFVSAINAGPDWADGARVVVPPGLPKESVGCMPSGGALCPSGAITGAQLEAGIAIPILPPGGRVNFQIFARVTPGVYAAMTASVTPPASLDDPRADNNNGSIGFQVVAP